MKLVSSFEYRHLTQRPKYKTDSSCSFGNGIDCFAQEMLGKNEGTDTLFFVNKSEIQVERWKDVAHSEIVCNISPQQEEVNSTRLTADIQLEKHGCANRL